MAGNNAVDYALGRIFRTIPMQILQMAFPADMAFGVADNRSLRDRIKQHVINERILPEANMVGGEVHNISLNGIKAKRVETGTIWVIPLSRTQGRKIMIPHLADIYDSEFQNGWNTDGGEANLLNHNVQLAMQSIRGPEGTHNTNVRLIGPNTVFIEGGFSDIYRSLRVTLENDVSFGNLSPRALIKFGELAVLGAKAEVYNNLSIAIGDGALSGGNVNGQIRQIIDNYADADQLYYEFLQTRWQKSAIRSDHKTYRSITRFGLHK